MRAASYHRPAGGGAESGDRHAVVALGERSAAFYLADAAGHGAVGAAFWRAHGDAFDAAWTTCVAAEAGLEALRGLGRALNARLRAGALTGLCLAAGRLDPAGLTVAVFGYGVHVLAPGLDGLPPDQRFGLKLGWLDPGRWEEEPRAFVARRLPGVTRVVALSDGFLGDDHADPAATLTLVDDLGRRLAPLSPDEALAAVRALPHGDDDATALVLDLGQ